MRRIVKPYNTLAWNRIRYSLYAPGYDLAAGLLASGRQRAIEKAELCSRERVLLSGAGTGLDLPYLPMDCDIHAVDLSPAMLRRARRRAKRLHQQVQWAIMNVERLAYGDGTFDAVLLHCILAVVPDPFACLREAARVLKPEGRVCIFDKFLPDEASPSRLRAGLNLITETLFSSLTRQLGPLMREAGLQPIQHEPASLGGAFSITIAAKNRPVA